MLELLWQNVKKKMKMKFKDLPWWYWWNRFINYKCHPTPTIFLKGWKTHSRRHWKNISVRGALTSLKISGIYVLCRLGIMERNKMESIFSMEVSGYKSDRAQLVTFRHQRQNKYNYHYREEELSGNQRISSQDLW